MPAVALRRRVGYNIQSTVDADHMFVIDTYAGGVTDRGDLGIAAKRAQDILQEIKIDFLADTGYHNGADIAYCERKGMRTFIPPGNCVPTCATSSVTAPSKR